MENNFKKTFLTILVTTILVSSLVGGAVGFWAGGMSSGRLGLSNLLSQGANNGGTVKVETQESAVISAVDKVSPAVVSIIITKNLPQIQNQSPFNSDFFRQFFGDNLPDIFSQLPQNNTQSPVSGGTVQQEIGGGSGFIVTPDGYIVTNKHVIIDATAEYTVLTNDGKKYAAKVIGEDPALDVAVLKISATNLPMVELGESLGLKVGQSVIAIGNALGEFRNTVSTGVISGLARSVTADGAGIGSEELVNVIQTDASINPGNSGGPLLNIAGQVVGINTAMAQGAQNIGFAIPIDEVKSTIDSVKTTGRIIRPWLGVRYVTINQALADANKLPVNYGALIARGQNQTDLAVIPGSPADKAGLVENDIILEINGQKITETSPLAMQIAKFKPGDQIGLKVLHQGKEKTMNIKLEEMK